MSKVGKVQVESSVRQQMDQSAHFACMFRFSIWRQAHHFILVAKLQESEELRDCEINQAERMREIGSVKHLQFAAAPHRPRGAYKVTESVDRANSRFVVWGDEERARQMRRMMLDPVNTVTNLFGIQLEYFRNSCRKLPDLSRILHAVQHQLPIRTISQRERCFPQQVGSRVPRYCKVIDFLRVDSCRCQTRVDRASREPSAMFNAAETLL